jgi:phospholipid/cholesterol/gamma-HCH transport system substrate-binding protein
MKKQIFTLEFKVGIFILIGLLIFFVFVFSQGKILRGKGYDVKILFNYVGGLDTGSPVRVSGYRVGEVKDLKILYGVEKTPQILVTIRLRPEIHLGRHTKFTIRSYGLIGDKYLDIMPTSLDDVPPIAPNETIIGVDPLPLERFLSAGEDILKNLDALLISLNRISNDKELRSNLADIAGEFRTVLAKTSTSLDTINKMADSWGTTSTELNRLIAENGPRISELITNVNDAAQEIAGAVSDNRPRVSNLITQASSTAKAVETLASTATIEVKDARETFAKTNERFVSFLDRIENKGVVADLMTDTELVNHVKKALKNFQQASTDFSVAFQKVGYMSEQVSEILSDVRSGKGTIGKLVSQEDLYNITLEMIKDLRAHPWKLLFRSR